MARKNLFQIAVALALIIGVPIALFVAAVYHAMSPRVWAIAMIAWFAALLLWAVVRKLTAKKSVALAPRPITDEPTRRRIVRWIWLGKVWIGALAVSLPFGIANGVAHRAWVPTAAGVAINLMLMYLTVHEIRRWRRRLNGSLRGA